MLSLPSVPTPSHVIHSAEHVASFLNSMAHPVSMNGVPVAMFSPPLAKLQHNIENLDALKPTNAEI